jgi:hypothetical protein
MVFDATLAGNDLGLGWRRPEDKRRNRTLRRVMKT